MRFTAVGFATLPDTEGAREELGLHDLNEADMAKVMSHRHEQTGGGGCLGWDQLRLGAVSLLRVTAEGTRLETFSLADLPEILLIDAVFQAMEANPPLLTWGGEDDFMPLLLFRCMRHRRSAADYYAALERNEAPHRDLRALLMTSVDHFPDLNDMAVRLGLPGMLGLSADTLWEQWIAGKKEALGGFARVQTVNVALLALEIAHLRGECSLKTVSCVHEQLYATLEGQPDRDDVLLESLLT